MAGVLLGLSVPRIAALPRLHADSYQLISQRKCGSASGEDPQVPWTWHVTQLISTIGNHGYRQATPIVTHSSLALHLLFRVRCEISYAATLGRVTTPTTTTAHLGILGTIQLVCVDTRSYR